MLPWKLHWKTHCAVHICANHNECKEIVPDVYKG